MIFRILTTMEYAQYKFILPKTSRPFWLDPCGIPTGNYPVVGENGFPDRFGQRPDCETVFFRPVIEMEPSDKLSYTPGYKAELFGLKWKAVSKTILVCDSCVSETKFNDYPCLYKDSYLNYRINTYFNELIEQQGIGKGYDPNAAASSDSTNLSVSSGAVINDSFPEAEILDSYKKSRKTSLFSKLVSGLGACLLGGGLVGFGIYVGSASIMSLIPAIGLFLSGSAVLGASSYLRNKKKDTAFYQSIDTIDKEYEGKQSKAALKQDDMEALRELVDHSGGGRSQVMVNSSPFTDRSTDSSSPVQTATDHLQDANTPADESASEDKTSGEGKFTELFDTSRLSNGGIKQKFKKINLMLSRIVSLQNRGVNQKIKLVYLPEIKKLYDIYLKYDGDGIESEGKNTFLALLEDNLDKTLQLLTIEYDKAHEQDILDVNLRTMTMQKMLEQEKTLKETTLKL